MKTPIKTIMDPIQILELIQQRLSTSDPDTDGWFNKGYIQCIEDLKEIIRYPV